MNDEEDEKKKRRARIDALLRKQDWGRIQSQLFTFAKARVASLADAEDLTAEAIRRVLDANWEPWDPDTQPDLLKFLFGIVLRERSNIRTKKRTHRELAMDAGAEVGSRAQRLAKKADAVPDGASSAEARLIAAELVSRRMERLRAEIAADPVVCAILEQRAEGVEKANEQADATRYSAEEIYDGRRRMGRHVTRVAREVPEESINEARLAEAARVKKEESGSK